MYSGKIDFHHQKPRYYILVVKRNIIYWGNVLLRNILNSGKKFFLMILTLLNLEVQKFQGMLLFD